MSRTHRILVARVAALALLVGCAGSSGQSSTGHAGRFEWPRPPQVVKFSYFAVEPESLRIATDDNVRWVNNAPDTQAFIVLPGAIASKFTCKDLRPYFSQLGDVYRSQPIVETNSEDVQLPCALAPGIYEYEIWLMGAGLGSEINSNQMPEKILKAKLVVRNPS